MFKFITGKPLWANILFALGIIVVILFIFLQSLNLLTKHGHTLTIPAVTGKSYDEAKKILEENGFDVEIQDSTYNDTAAALSVLRQFPDADEVVKVNRTVYLTINRAVPPTIEMPNLEGLSFRSAEIALQQYGLNLGDTTYKPDFAKNSVLEQHLNGQRIKAGTKLPMGSAISLVLGSGLGSDEFTVPDLTGMTYNEARILMESIGLSFGVVLPDGDVRDTLNAYIYRQDPERFTPDQQLNRIRQGQSVDIFLGIKKPVRPVDSLPASSTQPADY
ncbi:MAG: PASTA domain-containing protein [Candidatus Pseudobacter hemicellulosilyticus]|uniref:PASTA domain-containing protein n=1 Tax=Candidatus Pseudobacter hemicellulosilyticus TaxID=3121375 RepID=A0AAJ5WV96_9BACT|nr:MAG: PASTA domain-containing protein [Pseudobacter sp.]